MPRLENGTEYSRAGQTDAPSVVLIHGLGLNKDVWQWMIPELAQTHDVISYDLFGHGQSDPPPEDPSLTLFSDQLAELLEALNVSEAVIIGFSLGGMICRRFALDHPGKVRGLVILNSPHRRTAEAQDAILKRVEQARKAGPQATVEAALQRWFTEAFRTTNPHMMGVVRSWVLANDPNIYPSIYKVLADGIDEITGPACRLRCPALVITAEEDYGNGPEMTEAIARDIEGAEALILPGLRHMALAENPQAVNGPVRRFLDRLG